MNPTGLMACYLAAARAGLLHTCVWQPDDGRPLESRAVGFTSPDETLLEGLTLSRDYTMRYPATWLIGLTSGQQVMIDDQRYVVRDVVAMGDGSEYRAQLMKLIP